ncbi:MAG TPA: cytochrome c oxidase accessory protein CcoG [Sediminibacterium sp.]|uniref:cytochrome c oxidase accessory protein CcoG n=1 Tax=Sediminibacterium sp. TaxID=1917865 RepID=UPI000A810EEF|nr:cytochrome c oxidase accessory protein CcoG [Sediminibacterium sp.]HLD52160.1 cytochrome c oxidase accessory protein CcoG [Sediminibacterium sp.]HQS24281.1 cytochrome c oxidase accessory protein CcoG [Sediminibacterium sp.]HQS34627.1 cytochrome c oxidase accessory protein CcoG [Sediminibacterium sp.]
MSESKQADFRSLHSTVDSKGKRNWVHALQPKGKLYQYRTYLSYVYVVLFFSMPFIRIDGNPLFQFNIPQGEFTFFGSLFTPQDFIMFGLGMIIFMLFIVIFTLIYGRFFCGWVCPQTIFMEMIFRKIEYFIEGDGNKQKINNGKKWTTELYVRKTIKHIVFLVLSFAISNTFLAYIIGTDQLFKIITDPLSEHIGGFIAIIFFTLVFYTVYAFVREIVCTVICPYGRLQGVLLDKNSIVVAYDYLRGEPRNKKKATEGAGDCIDCGMCVNVCPTNIDIRNGTQLECVNCTACIDACNMMMKKVNKPENLITFASENQIASGKKFEFTYRIKAYSGVLVILMVLLGILIVTRTTFDATILRVPGQGMQENKDGTISNLFRIKVTNKSNRDLPYRLVATDPDVQIERIGQTLDTLKGRQLAEETFFIKVDSNKIKNRKEEYEIKLLSGDKVITTKKAIFISDL